MPLSSGQTLGPYQVLDLLGAGGMGEVYRARDTRLNREVALKILPAAMADDAAAFARFEREAQAVAALSHPNILAVHDFGRADAHRYVVFELLQGATLRERLDAGALPVRKAVDYARQVADGLAAAHARGITHRDIKPDNLFVTDDGRVKILDFGLAQTAPPADGSSDGVTSAHTQAPITGAGTVLGTVGYMAPEQIRGQAVDHRADIFALGATLYEMCTSRRAFKGATPADTMSAVLTSDAPELTLSGQPTPPALDRIVRRCLEKQPAERFQSARDLSFALDALSSLSGSGSGAMPAEPVPAGPRRGWSWPAAAAALVALAAGFGIGRQLQPPPPVPGTSPSLRAEFDSNLPFSTTAGLGLSPDGRRLVYAGFDRSTGMRHLFLRDLSTGQTITLPDSTDASLADWSPRSDAVLFVSGRDLRLFEVGNRSTRVLDTFRENWRGLAWLSDDTFIVCLTGDHAVQRRNLRGGPPVVVVQNPGDVTLALPRRIGRRTDYVLALRNTAAGALNRQTVLIRLSDGQVTSLVDTVASSVPAPGYLLSPQPRGLVAIPFDAERLMLTGAPILMPEAAEWDPPTGLAALAASDTGVLAYSRAVERPVQFEWLSATGQSLGVIGAADFYGAFALSPDGSRIVGRLIPGEKHPLGALRLIDIARNLTSPIVTPDALVSDPIWTVDGTRVVYRSGTSIVRQSPFSTVTEKVIDGIFYPDAFSRDGRWMLLGRADTAGAFALVAMPTDGSGPMVDVSADASASDEGSFSPDGRLVAYHSGRTGRSEIYLSPFPPTGERWQVSPDGGLQARWSADGRSLHYLDLTGKLVRVAIAADTPGRIGRPEVRFDLHIGRPSAIIEQYALHGDRVLVLRPPQVAAPLTVTVVSNWTETLPRAAAQAP